MNALRKLLLMGCVSVSIYGNATKLSIQISNPSAENKIVLAFEDAGKKEILIDKAGKGQLNFSDFTPGYVTLSYGPYLRTLWLEPHQDLSLSFDSGSFIKQITFEESLAKINRYLNDSKPQEININDASAKESNFMAKADSLHQENLQNLHRAELPEHFCKIEEQRLQYLTYSGFTYYVAFHPRIAKDSTYRPSEAYLAKVKQLCVEDASLLRLSVYENYMINAIQLLAKVQMPEVKLGIERSMSYIEKNITDAAIAEFLINHELYSHILRNGTKNVDKYMTVFQRYVKDAALVNEMDLLHKKWDSLQVGKRSPEFDATDATGKKVTLADLKGKFVYIDVWATWCAPCRKEMPFLTQMEEKYSGKDIHIVGLSCDRNRDAWEKSIAKGGKAGIQIHLVPDATFMSDYMIQGIPRFILLDREGNILNVDMTRPSEPETVKTLDALLN